MRKYVIFTVVITLVLFGLNLLLAGDMPKKDKHKYDNVQDHYEVVYDDSIYNTYKTYADNYKNKKFAAYFEDANFCHGTIETILSRVSENKMVFLPLDINNDNYFVLIKGYSKEGFIIDDAIGNNVVTISYEEFKKMWHSKDYFEDIYYYYD